MKNVKISLIGACLFMAACSTSISNKNELLELNGQNYSLHPSMKLNYRYDHKTSTVFTNYEAPKFNREPEDVSIEVYHTLTKCPLTPQHMPHVITEAVGDTMIRWGKVIFEYAWDPLPGENDVFCPPIEKQTTPFAFCAEKDGKAVAICIQQMTDNEEQAKQIFESFRWTD